jgi:small GTP-binding protein
MIALHLPIVHSKSHGMKVVIIGDSLVGKTCILVRLTAGKFDLESFPTIGAAFQNHVLVTENGSVTLHIWDTAGQEKYHSLTPMYYQNAQVAILVFDLTRLKSFESLDQWMEQLNGKRDTDLKIFLVGNKADLIDERAVEEDRAQDFAAKSGAVAYIKTSAKSGEGIIELFTKVAESGISIPLQRTALEEPKESTPSNECRC